MRYIIKGYNPTYGWIKIGWSNSTDVNLQLEQQNHNLESVRQVEDVQLIENNPRQEQIKYWICKSSRFIQCKN